MARPAAPAFTTGTWRMRINVDSAPTRQRLKEPLYGTVDFAAHRHAIDLRRIVNVHSSGAFITPLEGSSPPSTDYRIVLGDSSSFDEKIVMRGHLVGRDSIVGTWSETIVCCSAGGRFSLWRVKM